MKNLITIVLMAPLAVTAQAREWSDASGNYSFTGDLVASGEMMIVVETESKDKDLISIEVDQLSKRDRDYLERVHEKAEANPEIQTWTMKNGLQIRAAAVEFIRRDVTIQRRRGRVYVNDERYDNMPGVYRKTIPPFVSHFEENTLTEKTFAKWVKGLRGKTKTYVCDGVLLELESGNLYAFPFFFFSEKDLSVLKRGWEEWVEAEDDATAREFHSMQMRAQAASQRKEKAEQRQMSMLRLQLAGYDAGLFDVWEVAMSPPANVRGTAMRVVVPARNSDQARNAALKMYPNYRVGPMRKVSRKK